MTQNDALTIRARPHRNVSGLAIAAVLALTIGACDSGDRTDNAAASSPPTSAPATPQSTPVSVVRTASDGTQYAIAPPLGTESTLRRSGPAGLESVDPTASQRKLAEVFGKSAAKTNPVVAAVFLQAVNGVDYADAASFRPVYVLDDGSLVNSGLDLGWVRDSGGNQSVPLSPDAVAADRWAAFAQPGQVVVMNLRNGQVKTVPVPSPSIERVRWSEANTVVASGDEGSWQIAADSTSPRAVKLPKGYTGADQTITVEPSTGTSLTSWQLDGLKKETTPVKATIASTTGQTLSSNLIAATAVVLSNGEPVNGAYQGILAVPLADPTARRLLVMADDPSRQNGCCQVAGFLDKRTPLYTNVTAEGVWLLAWHPETGEVGRTFLLKANPAVPPVLSYGLSVD